MSLFGLVSILIVLAALFSYANHKYFRLPPTIGIMLLALGFSFALVLAGFFINGIHEWATGLIGRIDFNEAVLHGMLAFLLFAGSLHLDLSELSREKVPIILLAFFGTFISAILIGFGVFGVFALLHIDVTLLPCMLFGALISPTDPIAVLAIMQKVAPPKSLEIQIAGESLFNDGVGVVIFLTVLELTGGQHTPGFSDVLLLLFREAGGGAILGLVTGYATFALLMRVDEYEVEILLTLGLAMGGYALAEAIHVSAPIAAVVAGLFIGNHGRTFAMSDKVRENVDTFWKLIDGILNAVLFLLIGLEMLVIPFDRRFMLAGLIAVPITLIARWLSVASLLAPLRLKRKFAAGTIRILTWGALRGGVSVALALSLPPADHRNLLIVVTYVVVIFSIAAQGLTFGKVITAFHPRSAAAPSGH